MDTILKNILICGVGLMVVYWFSAIVQVNHAQSAVEDAEAAARELGRNDAHRSAAAGEFLLFASAHGFSGRGRSIPALNSNTYESCLIDFVRLEIYKTYTDVMPRLSPEERFQQLSNQPKTTEVYAESFNSEMLNLLPGSTITGCRSPYSE